MISKGVLSRLGRAIDFKGLWAAYNLVFRTPNGLDYVLPDLLEFTRANDPAARDGTEYQRGREQGRRDVWLHIQEYLQLTEDERYALWQGRASMRPQDFK